MRYLPFLPTLVCAALCTAAPPALAHPSDTAALAPAQARTASSPLSDAIEPRAILAAMERVADWQLAHPTGRRTSDWTEAVGDTGMMALAGLSSNPKYRDAMLRMGEDNGWKLGPNRYHADDQTIGQTYAELYLLLRDPKMIAPLRAEFDDILANPHEGTLAFTKKERDRWTWCDALYMAAPVWIRLFAATGDRRYLDFAVAHWWRTSDYLYDKDEHLFYRDSTFIAQRDASGHKIFWSRGNGWVVAALVRMLQYLPPDHPERARFERQFKDMAARLLGLQQTDGLWRVSLLSPAVYSQKETSGSALNLYALAWGINQGLLDAADYGPAARRSWRALVASVAPDGKLIHVQPSGSAPNAFDEGGTEVYGVGAFLLAGSEMARLAAPRKAD